jgi:hypothetical protein
MIRVVVVGTISNAASSLEKDLTKVINALVNTEILQVYIVESDSEDKTVEVLAQLSSRLTYLKFQSLGSLKLNLPKKISRIRLCRQVYVEFIRDYMKSTPIDFVVVVDLDGMNKSIKAKAVDGCFLKPGWDVVLANQTGGYYDLLALRHPTWCPTDIKSELDQLRNKVETAQITGSSISNRVRRLLALDNAARKIVYSRMRSIPKSSPWVEVESGFGGFAIYRADLFEKFDYSVADVALEEECEHIALNTRIHKSGGKLYINPSLINSRYNEHNIRKFFLVRQFQLIYWSLISATTRHRDILKRIYK